MLFDNLEVEAVEAATEKWTSQSSIIGKLYWNGCPDDYVVLGTFAGQDVSTNVNGSELTYVQGWPSTPPYRGFKKAAESWGRHRNTVELSGIKDPVTGIYMVADMKLLMFQHLSGVRTCPNK